MRSEVTAVLDGERAVVAPVQNERRHSNKWEERSDVGLKPNPVDHSGGGRTGTAITRTVPPRAKVVIARNGRCEEPEGVVVTIEGVGLEVEVEEPVDEPL